MPVTLNSVEVACAKLLAARFSANNLHWDGSEPWEAIGLTEQNFAPVLSTLEAAGVIQGVEHSGEQRFEEFTISAKAVQVARKVEDDERLAAANAAEGENIVASIQKYAQKNKYLAPLIIAVIVGTALTTCFSQVLNIIDWFSR